MYIPDCIFENISPYVGPGNFIYFPLTCSYALDAYKNTYPKTYNTTTKSIILSSISCLKSAIDLGVSISYEDYHRVAYNVKTRIECSELSSFLLKSGVEWDVNSIYCAIQSTNISYLKWVGESGVKWSEEGAMHLACSNGNMEIVMYLYGIGIYPTNICGNISANFDRRDILIWLYFNKFINDDFMVVLAECGFIDTLVYFIDRGVKCKGDVLDSAAGGGNIDIVRYLIDGNICNITPSTISFAAASGCRDVVRFFMDSYDNMLNEETMDIIGRYCDI